MTDSPLPRIPLDPKEQPILDKLQSIRTELELLKRDRSTYVKSQDVLKLYDQVIEQDGATIYVDGPASTRYAKPNVWSRTKVCHVATCPMEVAVTDMVT